MALVEARGGQGGLHGGREVDIRDAREVDAGTDVGLEVAELGQVVLQQKRRRQVLQRPDVVTAGTQVTFAGSGDAGSSGSRINTSAPAIDVTTTGGADVFVTNKLDTGVTLTGNTTASNTAVSVVSRNTADTARDVVIIGAGNLVNSGTGSSVTLSGSTLLLTGGITSPSITLDFAGDLTGSGTLVTQTFSMNNPSANGVVYSPKTVTFTANTGS